MKLVVSLVVSSDWVLLCWCRPPLSQTYMFGIISLMSGDMDYYIMIRSSGATSVVKQAVNDRCSCSLAKLTTFPISQNGT